MRAPQPSPGEAIAAMAAGAMDVLGLLPGASNFTYLAVISDGDRPVLVVYKPRDGEAPLWDFPEGTLCRREVAAYVLASALGWPAVPPTILRDGPDGPGAVQLFVHGEPDEHYFTLRERRPGDFHAVAAFDVLANNADRKAGHCLLGRDGVIWCIDHGLCFAVEPKLRTVIWDFAREPVPGPLLDDVRRVGGELRSGRLRRTMLELLTPREVDATADRADRLVESGRFPVPGARRHYPWPLV